MEEFKKIIEMKDEKLQLAATFGNQLLEDNNRLNERLEAQSSEHMKKLEELEQEKYRLKMSLDLKERIANTQVAEIDNLKETVDNLTKLNRNLKEREKELQKKVLAITKEKNYLEEIHEETAKNETKWKERATLLESQLQTAQDHLHHSTLNETFNEEISSLRRDLQQLLIEKQTLEQELSDVTCELENCKKQERKMAESFDNSLEMLKEKEMEIETYSKTIEQYKEEMCELKLEGEMMKMGQTDPNARGNSLFAEVDDRRKLVEKELISMRIKYDVMKEKLSFSVQQTNKMKYHMAALLGMASQKSDVTYIHNLEQTLELAKQEIKELKQQLSEFKKVICLPKDPIVINNVSQDDGYDYLKEMLKQSRKECEELKKEMQNAILYKAAETDRVINCQRDLYQEQKKSLRLQGEVVRLHTKIDELQKIDDIPVPKPIVEKLSVDNKENTCKKMSTDSAKRKVAISNDIIVNKEDGQTTTEKLKDEHVKCERHHGRRAEAPIIDMSNQIVNDCSQQ